MALVLGGRASLVCGKGPLLSHVEQGHPSQCSVLSLGLQLRVPQTPPLVTSLEPH